MISQHRYIALLILVIFTGSLTACGTVNKVRGVLANDGGVNYQNNQKVKLLEVPPDLTKPEFDKAFELPTGVVSAVSLSNGGSAPAQSVSNTSTNTTNVGTVRRGDLSSIKSLSGKTVLQVNDTYSRSLILTEIMLKRMGFSTVSKSSLGNVITAQYNGEDVNIVEGENTGWLSRFKNIVTFGSEKRKLVSNNKALIKGQTYRISITNEQGSPIVIVTKADGQNLSNAAHAKIITLLNTAFNS